MSTFRSPVLTRSRSLTNIREGSPAVETLQSSQDENAQHLRTLNNVSVSNSSNQYSTSMTSTNSIQQRPSTFSTQNRTSMLPTPANLLQSHSSVANAHSTLSTPIYAPKSSIANNSNHSHVSQLTQRKRLRSNEVIQELFGSNSLRNQASNQHQPYQHQPSSQHQPTISLFQSQEMNRTFSTNPTPTAETSSAYESYQQNSSNLMQTTYTPYSYAFPSFSRSHQNPINPNQTHESQNDHTMLPNVTPTYGTHNIPYCNQILHALPQFNGNPEDWPFFISQYNESTKQYNYTPLQTTSRLSQALTGEALESVKCFLINPNNTDHVINTLEFLFGRPELVLDNELRKIRKIAKINEVNVKEIIPFSIKIQQLVCVLELLPNKLQHLNNPTLLREIVEKLPLSKRELWFNYALNLGKLYTIKDFCDWIYTQANILRLAIVEDQSFNSNNCQLCGSDHLIFKCSTFKNLSIN